MYWYRDAGTKTHVFAWVCCLCRTVKSFLLPGKKCAIFLACEFILQTSVRVNLLCFCWEGFVVSVEGKKDSLIKPFTVKERRIRRATRQNWTLHWPWRRGSHDSNRSHHFQDWAEQKKKSFQWFTVMPTHCAPSIVIKFFHEMCCSSAQMYQDVLRKTGRKTNEELKTELIEFKYCRNHIYQ